MGKIISFHDLSVWHKAHCLVLQVYKETKEYPKSEIYGLTSQIRRAAVSVASNIVEGFERKSAKDSLHFYNIADGSLEELRYQLLLSKDLFYLDECKYAELVKLSEEVSKMLNGWIKSNLKSQ
ncbi:MAG TPA: four helix bundle protein [Candidatus Paceibacterota bacterium]|nr:four helix bundle protein [Candidatus Pacearchaeota archaeon]HRZ50679.1 four helix bundle protein [Candidatus Paceibacterota bacterium]HSA36424.1 four helix bundle protein [Candidatus Paceibacterota bacterium]